MAHPVYRLPASRPVLWQTPDSLQVGLDLPHTTVTDIPDNAAPLIHALSEGLSEGGLRVLGKQLGVSDIDSQKLIDQFRPALEPSTPQPLRRLGLVGHSRAVSTMATVLGGTGCDITAVSDIHEFERHPADGLLLIADYTPHPDWVAVLGSSDTVHTPVVFSDLSIRVGPRVIPGQTPCLTCWNHYQRGVQPHWLNLHSQLWGQVSPQSTRAGATIASILAALVHGLVGHTWPGQTTDGHGTIVEYRPEWPELVTTRIDFDQRCTCRGLSID